MGSIEEIEGELFVSFREDLDIYTVHKYVTDSLQKLSYRVIYLEEKIDYLKSLLKIKRTHVEKVMITRQIDELKSEMNAMPSNISDYGERAEELFDRYEKIPEARLNNKTYTASENDIQRIECIMDYLTLAKKYVKITHTTTGYNKIIPTNLCYDCSYDLSMVPIQKGNIIECPECGRTKILQNKSLSKTKEKNSEVVTKEISLSMKKCFDEYIGKINLKLDKEKLVKDLNIYFAKKGIPTSKEAEKIPLSPNGKKRGTSTSKMRIAIKSCGYTCYGAARYLCKLVWGWSLQDLSSLEMTIINDAISLELGYQRIPEKLNGRKASISKQATLYFLLRNRGVDVDQDDFKIPKDKRNCNNLLELACEYCDDKEIKFRSI